MERDVYVERLTRIGYRQDDAVKIAGLHFANQNLDALEKFIAAKEAIEGVD